MEWMDRGRPNISKSILNWNPVMTEKQGGSNFETIFSTRVFATIFSLFEMFVLTISSPYQKKESYVKV